MTGPRVFICDDHVVFADSLAVVLADAGHQIVGVTYHPDEAVARLRSMAEAGEPEPELCLIDVNFPDGEALGRLAELRAAAPGAGLVLLTGHLDQRVLDQGLAAGVRGFADKGQSAKEIVALLARVLAGELVTGPRPSGGHRSRSQAQQVAQFLTPREREVLTRLARGESTTALAKEMGVTRSTARTHVQSVLTKLGVHSQREAVIEAARGGLLSVETGEWLVN